MADAALDTHKLVKKLTASGFSEDAAEALAEALLERRDDLVTKGDIEHFRQELKADIGGVDTGLRGEVSSLRTELHAERSSLRTELRADITAAKFQLVLILLPSMAALLAVFRYLP